jgi:hypothetical protein
MPGVEMNAVEIEEAVSKLAEAPFDTTEFPYLFLEAFGNKDATLKRLRSGNTNQSDVGGVLQRSNIHLKTCPPGTWPRPSPPCAAVRPPRSTRQSSSSPPTDRSCTPKTSPTMSRR